MLYAILSCWTVCVCVWSQIQHLPLPDLMRKSMKINKIVFKKQIMEKRIKIRLVDKLPLMIRINMFISTSTSLWISVKNISCKSFSSSSHVLVHNKHSIHICLKANTYFPLGLQFPETGTKMSEFLILLENARIFFPPVILGLSKVCVHDS